MFPVHFEVVPSVVNTLLPAFLQILKAAGECHFRNACELHCRCRLASIFSRRRPFSLYFFSRGNRKNRTERDQRSTGNVAVLPSFTHNLMLTRSSNRTSILLTAKIATGKGHGVSAASCRLAEVERPNINTSGES
jgi:hypothetical protein